MGRNMNDVNMNVDMLNANKNIYSWCKQKKRGINIDNVKINVNMLNTNENEHNRCRKKKKRGGINLDNV